ncbi:THO complex subunit 5A [Magnolia sinica]|uniref:THO complex subunit 5A n=1 Tax=Magnolia sinica TaxID=86752 RepID=UPI002659F996|nr:THO complex subunit 5A [Magnolia sinica]
MEKTAYEMLEETRTSMEEIAAKMLFIKKEGRPKAELRELITQFSLLSVFLRQINRSILLEEDRVKAETERAKAPVDFTTLQLQNLMYEKNHYMKAIKACKDFKSKHPDIELVPEEEFFNNAPEEIKGGVLAEDNAHDLMLKRLNFELFQRKELCKLHEKLEERKRSLLEVIANRKKFLSSLPSHLKYLKKASLPVQQQLGIQHTKKLKQHHSAELLPPPLYVIYSQFLAQKEAFGENIDLEILGSMKDAQAFANQQANKDTDIGTITENSRYEDDAPDEEEDGQRRRKRPKKVPSRESLDHAGVYQSHPLKIVLHVYDDEASDAKPVKLIALRFEYLLKLNVVCVGIEGSDEGPESNILCNLFPDDTGVDLPHQTAKLFVGDAVSFDERKTSRPYKWAQHLAGIDFLPEVSPLLTASEARSSEAQKSAAIQSGLSTYRQQNRVQTVVQRIRSRKKAHLALVEQLDSLTKLKWPPLIYENVPWGLHTASCTLQSWLSVGSTPIQASSSLSAVATEKIPNSLELDMDGRSAAFREDVESAREDGELPIVLQAPTLLNDSKLSSSRGSDLEHSRHLALISKSMMPGNKGRSMSFKKPEDNMDLILDSESDLEELVFVERETENAASTGGHEMVGNSWEDYAVREFCLVLSKKTERNERHINLEAKIKISMEYPLRPPLFTLRLSTVISGETSFDAAGGDSGSCEKDSFGWYNELRAMEAEVNLHILKMVPPEYEDHILAHQVHSLAMLFDFQMDQASALSVSRKSTSVIEVGLCKPIGGRILTRSFRGRDRRKMISWKDVECTPGYPY